MKLSSFSQLSLKNVLRDGKKNQDRLETSILFDLPTISQDENFKDVNSCLIAEVLCEVWNTYE